MAKINKVLYNIDQRNDTTAAEKKTARDNIGAGTGNSDVVLKTTSMTVPPVDTQATTLQLFTDGRLRFDNTDVGVIAPYPSQSDTGKILSATYAGSPGRSFAQWVTPPVSLPESAASDAGKALIVDSSGDPAWSNVHHVSYDANQGLTSTQQKNARLNIAAVSQSQINDLHGLLYIRSLTNSHWISNPIIWAGNSGRHSWRGIVKWTLQPGDTLFCMLNGQLVESDTASTEWAVSLNTSDAYPSSESFSHYFSTNSRSSSAQEWTNIPGTMLSYANGNSEQEVTLGVYNSSAVIPSGGAALYGKVYGTPGDGRLLSGPCVWYCILNTRSRGYQET